jgi:hypothetical protein
MPEKARGRGSMRTPQVAEFFKAFRCRTRTRIFHFLNGDGQRQIADRPDVRTTQRGKQIDVRSPCANAFERDEEFACSVDREVDILPAASGEDSYGARF